MRNWIMKLLGPILLAFVVLQLPAVDAQAAWPDRPIKLIVPYSPGGGCDTIGRMFSETLSGPLGQQIVVENKPGAGATIGAHFVARAPADGYTLLIAPTALFSITHHLRKLPYNPDTDLMPVAQLSDSYMIMAARKNLPANNWSEFVALAKKAPGKLTYGSPGIATATHLRSENVHDAVGIKLLHVPYKGSAEALADLIGERIDVLYDPVSLPQVKAGNVKALAIMGDTRHPDLPNVPTLQEQGLVVATAGWFGLAAPRGTPPEIIQRLAAEIKKAFAAPSVKEKLVQYSQYPAFVGPEDFVRQTHNENILYKDLVKKLDIKIE